MKEAIAAIRELAAKIEGGMESYIADEIRIQIQHHLEFIQQWVDNRTRVTK